MTVPAHGPATPTPGPRPAVPATAPDDAALADLRAAVAALPDAEGQDVFDTAEHAARFETVHDALVAVLADVDGT